VLERLGFASFCDVDDFLRWLVRLAIDLAFVAGLVRGVYLRLGSRQHFAFSCVMLNIMTFSVCMLLRKVPVELGFALGLFGVFGILRYRTDAISTRDLTYLFVALGLGLLNAVSSTNVSLIELLLINSTIVGTAAVLEYGSGGGPREIRRILYDNLELLKPGKDRQLLLDLAERTGLEVLSYSIDEVDLLRDAAKISVSCALPRAPNVQGAVSAAPPAELPGAAPLAPDGNRVVS
jgi:hypothetical protein